MSDSTLIDSHCHLIFKNFEEDFDEVVNRWRSKGVKKLLHACVEFEDIPKIKLISHNYSEIFYSVGLHPLDAGKWNRSSKTILKQAVYEDKRIVAIGELGLDLFKNKDLDIQMDALIPQMELAYECNLPVIIHCRDASREMIDLCRDLTNNNRCPKGVLHCWSGTVEEMKEFLKLGFYISFSGIVTFPKAYQTHECARLVPCDKYLIETDSPFLAPVPFRGKRNEPSYVANVAKSIATLRLTSFETIAKESSKNAEELFKFDLVK